MATAEQKIAELMQQLTELKKEVVGPEKTSLGKRKAPASEKELDKMRAQAQTQVN